MSSWCKNLDRRTPSHILIFLTQKENVASPLILNASLMPERYQHFLRVCHPRAQRCSYPITMTASILEQHFGHHHCSEITMAIRLATGSFLGNVLIRERTTTTSSQIWFSTNFYTWFSISLASFVVLCILSSASKNIVWRWGPQTSPSCHGNQGTKVENC